MGVSGSAIAQARKEQQAGAHTLDYNGSRFSAVLSAAYGDYDVVSETKLSNGKIMRLKAQVTGDEALDECAGSSHDTLIQAALRLGALRLEPQIEFQRSQAEGRDSFEDKYGDPLIDAAKAKQVEEASAANQAALEELPMFGMF